MPWMLSSHKCFNVSFNASLCKNLPTPFLLPTQNISKGTKKKLYSFEELRSYRGRITAPNKFLLRKLQQTKLNAKKMVIQFSVRAKARIHNCTCHLYLASSKKHDRVVLFYKSKILQQYNGGITMKHLTELKMQKTGWKNDCF